MWFSLTFPWLFQSVQNSLTCPWLENAFPFFQVSQVLSSPSGKPSLINYHTVFSWRKKNVSNETTPPEIKSRKKRGGLQQNSPAPLDNTRGYELERTQQSLEGDTKENAMVASTNMPRTYLQTSSLTRESRIWIPRNYWEFMRVWCGTKTQVAFVHDNLQSQSSFRL